MDGRRYLEIDCHKYLVCDFGETEYVLSFNKANTKEFDKAVAW